MANLSRPSSAPGTSLAYITIGAVMAVLAGTSFFFFDGTGNRVVGYIRLSFLIIGLVLMVIGFAVGHIGREALKSEIALAGASRGVARENQANASRGAAAAQQPAAQPAQAPQTAGTPSTNSVTQT